MNRIHYNIPCVVIITIILLSLTALAETIKIERIGAYESGKFDRSSAEIPAYDAGSRQIFIVNAADRCVDILDIRDPAKPRFKKAIDIKEYGHQPNCVAVHNGRVAVAVENSNKTKPGCVVFFNVHGEYQGKAEVGPLPDMLIFTPDGTRILAANEGEPGDDYTVDPEGSVSIIDMVKDINTATPFIVREVSFRSFQKDKTLIRVFGPGATLAQDVEPEYIAISADSKTAWIVLQENNAMAILDIDQGQFVRLLDLGTRDYNRSGYGFDPSDRDRGIHIGNWPVKGFYQPDAIQFVRIGDEDFLLTANEGDVRDYKGFKEEIRVEDLKLDPIKFPKAAGLQAKEALGRLVVSKANGDTNGDGDHDELYAFGARSFAIWSPDGDLVFESGDAFEQITAKAIPKSFNSDNNENNSFDQRSDNKGPEPEGLAVAVILGKTYAFIGLERTGGIICYDITDPRKPVFIQYINPRNWSGDPKSGNAGDLGPEGLLFISAEASPDGVPLLVVTNEVSGTTALYHVLSSGR